MIDVRCKRDGRGLKLRLDAEDRERAWEMGLKEVEVERFCPYCQERHTFQIPVPSREEYEREDPPKEPLKPRFTCLMEAISRSPILFQDVTTTPFIELSRQFWKVEKMVRSSDRETLEEALKLVEPVILRYEDKRDERTVAAAKIFKAQALLGLDRPEEVRPLLDEALPVLDAELDSDMIARAKGLRATIPGDHLELHQDDIADQVSVV